MKFLKRIFKPVRWHNLRTTMPISRVFGFDRGTPVDRYYIERFLKTNSSLIKGSVLEIENNFYTMKFGTAVAKSEVLHFTADNQLATVTGDLTDKQTLRENFVDCFICTQTFNFICDFEAAVSGAHYVLKQNGTLLATLAGLCQVSQYDMERWGDFWRFTTRSAEEVFGKIFGKENIQVGYYGNVLTGVALLHGVSSEELTPEELNVQDPAYQIIITVIAKKC